MATSRRSTTFVMSSARLSVAALVTPATVCCPVYSRSLATITLRLGESLGRFWAPDDRFGGIPRTLRGNGNRKGPTDGALWPAGVKAPNCDHQLSASRTCYPTQLPPRDCSPQALLRPPCCIQIRKRGVSMSSTLSLTRSRSSPKWVIPSLEISAQNDLKNCRANRYCADRPFFVSCPLSVSK
jgi:hypothetical protein